MTALLLFLAYSFQAPSELITVEHGDLPIIITAPHGGQLDVAGVSVRVGTGIKKFTTVRDANTDLLAKDIARDLEKELGAKPFLVVAKFSRKYIDANRPANEAYETDAAKPTYDAYEKAIADDQTEILKRWGKGILLDVHGQGRAKDTIYRGTNNLKTVQHWLTTFGADSFTGNDGVLGRMVATGFKLFPANDSTEKEFASLDGGYTVQRYGSAKGGNFDALQLEFGSAYRTKDARPKTAATVADALAPFIRANLLSR